MKELVTTPFIKRASKFRRKRKPISKSRLGANGVSNSAPAQHQPYPEEQIFCILNEKSIFQTLKEATISNDANNNPYFIYEAL